MATQQDPRALAQQLVRQMSPAQMKAVQTVVQTGWAATGQERDYNAVMSSIVTAAPRAGEQFHGKVMEQVKLLVGGR